ncbi:MAG: GGDEF domain-containing protein [Arcobacter sp.]|nr:MAG: GGDEF domain-containing protein [Arcobacter sp.]
MNEITEVINTTLENLNKENKLITPLNYEKEFFSLLKKTDLILEDYVDFEEITNQLTKEEKAFFNENNITTFKELAIIFSKRIEQSDIKEFLKHLAYYMRPSLNNIDVKNDIDKVCAEIASNPNNLISNESKRKLRSLTNIRIKNERQFFDDKSSDVKKLVLFISDYFKKILVKNKTSIEEVITIKNEIKNLKLSNSSLDDLLVLQDRLLEATEKFEKALLSNNVVIKNTKNESELLYEQIEVLQESLIKAEEEKSIDYLTGVLTRRAFEMESERIEKEYKVYDSNYAVVFFDIDHFKKINDTHGHGCGDIVLSTFSSILKKLTRTEDLIVRYGGEEFVTIVHYKNKIEISNYLRRVKNIITNNKFVCKNIKLNVQFCAGVSFRNNYNSYEEALLKADNLLYKAKQSGRNKIILDNDEIY